MVFSLVFAGAYFGELVGELTCRPAGGGASREPDFVRGGSSWPLDATRGVVEGDECGLCELLRKTRERCKVGEQRETFP